MGILLKKLVIFVFVSVVALSTMFPIATAGAFSQSSAVGGGTFVMQHDNELHKHFFGFSVRGTSNPTGTFHLICMHDNELCMIIQSIKILSFQINEVQGGLSATFIGTTRVMMQNQGWTNGWIFTVTVSDFGPKGVGNDYIVFEISNSEVHHMEGTLTAGNIVILN
jgi:hypothetical protein